MSHKTKPVIIFLIIWGVFFSGVLQAEMMYFLNVPGAKGGVTEEAFKGWLELKTIRYRLPDVPAPEKLLTQPPSQTRGLLTEKDLEKPICSFSKLADKSDKVLTDALKKKKTFPIWELAVCAPDRQVVMTILFKGVTIKGVTQRGEKNYVTFSFQRAVWQYTPPTK
jgi:hypothetical protein